jgi:hypothetical protein
VDDPWTIVATTHRVHRDSLLRRRRLER